MRSQGVRHKRVIEQQHIVEDLINIDTNEPLRRVPGSCTEFMSAIRLTSTFPPSSPPLPPNRKYFSSQNEGYVKVKLQSFYRVVQPMSSYTHKMSACLSYEKKRKRGALIWVKKITG